MTIFLPVEEKSLDAAVCPSFGRAPLFACADTQSGDCRFLENPAVTSQGGAGIKAAQFLADGSANALITFRCGENAAQVLTAAGIMLYKAQAGSLNDNIKALQDNRLPLLEEIHTGFHHHGGGSK
ncbi:NifB/NifX family molybdenum-iron cluster-binding protein [Oscillospiraceae bacterium LTW-04]|nr:NifB/NifX family molybdenum-iron cluster-binding protein [Oscillospiraceae bacterium MB24-C1]